MWFYTKPLRIRSPTLSRYFPSGLMAVWVSGRQTGKQRPMNQSRCWMSSPSSRMALRQLLARSTMKFQLILLIGCPLTSIWCRALMMALKQRCLGLRCYWGESSQLPGFKRSLVPLSRYFSNSEAQTPLLMDSVRVWNTRMNSSWEQETTDRTASRLRGLPIVCLASSNREEWEDWQPLCIRVCANPFNCSCINWRSNQISGNLLFSQPIRTLNTVPEYNRMGDPNGRLECPRVDSCNINPPAMLLSQRLFCSYKYYKQIAELMGMPVYRINQDITHQGSCVLYDRFRSAPRTTTMEDAREQACNQKYDLILLREGEVPSLQLKPYVYDIYRNFAIQLKKPKKVKAISLTSRIMTHDLNNKLEIARRLFKKGFGNLRLVGSSDSEDNKKVLEKFVDQLGDDAIVSFELEKMDAGRRRKQEAIERWVCTYQLKELVPHVNYELLDRRYLRMFKRNVSLDDIRARNSRPTRQDDEDEESDQERVNPLQFFTKKEGQEYLFRLVNPSQPQQRAKETEVQAEDRDEDQDIDQLANLSPGKAREYMRFLQSQGQELQPDELEKLQMLQALESHSQRKG